MWRRLTSSEHEADRLVLRRRMDPFQHSRRECLSTLTGFDALATIEFYRIELTHRRKS